MPILISALSTKKRNHSNRKLVEALQYNIVYRWFCEFTLEDKVPDQSIFSKMKKRFGADTFARFFNSILQQCIDNGLVKSNSVMTDSTFYLPKRM